MKKMDEPEHVPIHLLRQLTDNFSKDRVLGKGSYGEVYWGVTKNGDDVAVKKLRDILNQHDLGHQQFKNEFDTLKKLKHKNIVQVIAYCYETEKTYEEYHGRMVQAEMTHRALCLEYMHNGSLQNHLSDVHGLDWHTKYKIIKGTCQGLRYIHEELHYHLDLKPANILLNQDMVPKIADFGLSRLVIGKGQAGITQSVLGTVGYQPPEYIEENKISDKFDIFSLGVVMMQILLGSEGRYIYPYMSSDEVIDIAQENGRNMLPETYTDSLLEAYCHQVNTCTHIALSCVETDSKKRLSIVEIIDMLNETETKIDNKGTSQKIDFEVIREEPSSILMRNPSVQEKNTDIREVSSDVVEELIVGRTQAKMEIVSLLDSTKENIIILPIYGIGGIGKTTFAKLIYNDNKFRSYSHVWVYVSQRFNMKEIGNSITSQLSENKIQTNQRHEDLTQPPSGEKVLIVLDDMWEDDRFQLEELRIMLTPAHGNNTIVLVTTRSESIALQICTTLRPYKIKPLTVEMCWEIIKQRSDFETRNDKSQLTGIGRAIARKCGGVALAAQSLGFMLKSMSYDQWMKVKDSDIWNESISEDASLPKHVLASLKLSYTSIDDPCLRSCFTYCAMFLKGQKIFKHDLFYQWISLGFIETTKIMSIMERCEDYIKKLVGLSFLHYTVPPATVGAYVALFTMHDLVHELARLLMVDEILNSSKQHMTGKHNCRYALLNDCRKPLEASTSFLDKITALRFVDCEEIFLHCHAFSSGQSLQVLDLSQCRVEELPHNIGQLEQLGYLHAAKIQSDSIPEGIANLSKLVYLNLSGSNLKALPELIGEIRGLMHLDISNCENIKRLPESFLKLRKLVYLDLSGCDIITEALGDTGSRLPLPLDGLSKVFSNLIELRYLGLSRCLVENSVFWMIQRKECNMLLCSFIDCICTLYNLGHLDLSNNDAISSVPNSIGNLTKLHTLDLSNCPRLSRLPKCMDQMDSLRTLNVASCESLDLSGTNILALLPHFMVHAVDGASSSNIGWLQHVNPKGDLQISGLDNVKSLEEVRNVNLIEKQGITYLKLEWTRDARGSIEDVDVLRALVPPSTLTIFELKGYNSVSFPDWVMSIALSLHNLTFITISDLSKCNHLPPLGQLPDLKVLVVRKIDMLTTIGKGLCGGVRAFPQLKRFHLCSMAKLEAWDTNMDGMEGEFMFPYLEELEIRDCPNLILKSVPPRAMKWLIENSDNVLLSSLRKTSIPSSGPVTRMEVIVGSSKVPFEQWRLFDHLATEITLRITKCASVQTGSSQKIMRDIPCIKLLSLEVSIELQLPKMLGGLVSLKKLRIVKWPRLLYLPESMRHLTSLEELYLEECSNITTLPEWLGDLAALRILEIDECIGIKSLPQSLHKSKLINIYINGQPQLHASYQQEETQNKFPDNEEVRPPEDTQMNVHHNTRDIDAYIAYQSRESNRLRKAWAFFMLMRTDHSRMSTMDRVRKESIIRGTLQPYLSVVLIPILLIYFLVIFGVGTICWMIYWAWFLVGYGCRIATTPVMICMSVLLGFSLKLPILYM